MLSDFDREQLKAMYEDVQLIKEPNWFELIVPEDMMRQMSRKTYYEVKSWLRLVRRNIMLALQPPEIKWFQLNEGHSCSQ